MADDLPLPDAPAPPAGFLRARRRALALVFFLSFAGIFTAFMLHGLSVAPEYISTAVIEATRKPDAPEATRRNFDACAALLESDALAAAIARKMSAADMEEFLAPFPADTRRGPPDPVRLLMMRHWVKPEPQALRIQITFEHPDPLLAARFANLYAGSAIEFLLDAHAQKSRTEIEALRVGGGAAPAVLALQAQFAEDAPSFKLMVRAVPSVTPYEPRPMLLVSDGVILGLNLAAATTFLVGAILHLRTRPKPPAQS